MSSNFAVDLVDNNNFKKQQQKQTINDKEREDGGGGGVDRLRSRNGGVFCFFVFFNLKRKEK